MEYAIILQYVLPWVLAGAVSWGGVKAGLNGQREQLKRVSNSLDTHVVMYHEDRTEVVVALSKLGVKVDLLIDHKIKE